MSRTEFLEAGWATAENRPSVGKTHVMFKNVPQKDNYQSTLQGRPVFRDRIHIVKIVADQFLTYDQPMQEEDKERYPEEWARWEQTKETRILGTPLDMAPFLSDTQKAEIRVLKIFTIEQLAGLPDSMAQRIMGFADIRRKAQTFVESGKDAELVARIKSESDEKVAALQAQLDEMRLQMAEMKGGKKAKAE